MSSPAIVKRTFNLRVYNLESDNHDHLPMHAEQFPDPPS